MAVRAYPAVRSVPLPLHVSSIPVLRDGVPGSVKSRRHRNADGDSRKARFPLSRFSPPLAALRFSYILVASITNGYGAFVV